jgi:hypothetical protein
VRLTAPISEAGFRPGTNVTVAATASSTSGIARVEFFAGATLLGVDTTAPYTASWSAAAVGEYSLTAVAYDTTGISATSSPVHIYVLEDPGAPPTVEITSPLDGESITAPTQVIGSVSSPALRDWTLEYRRLGDECGVWLRLAQGSSDVANASLGTFDPTLLLNGHYELKLSARDRFGDYLLHDFARRSRGRHEGRAFRRGIPGSAGASRWDSAHRRAHV